MNSNIGRDQRVMWAFWIAAALAAIGAIAPILFSVGAHSRLAGVIIPFGIATIALAVNGYMHNRGRPLAVSLYFIAGIAIVYGILAMVAVPLRLAVVGVCPPAPARCPVGFEQQLTSGENSGLGVATFTGVLAIFIGFYALLLLYRRHAAAVGKLTSLWPSQPPAKPPAPAETPTAAVAPEAAAPAEAAPAMAEPPIAKAAPAAQAPEAPAAVRPRSRPRARARVQTPGEPKELSAPTEPKELPAPEELKELPPPA